MMERTWRADGRGSAFGNDVAKSNLTAILQPRSPQNVGIL
jgi:hypothetical protein